MWVAAAAEDQAMPPGEAAEVVAAVAAAAVAAVAQDVQVAWETQHHSFVPVEAYPSCLALHQALALAHLAATMEAAEMWRGFDQVLELPAALVGEIGFQEAVVEL